MTPLVDQLLRDVRVVEWGGGIAAAVAGQFLASLGAEVTRLEGPSAEPLRVRGTGLDLALHHRKRRVAITGDEPAAVLAALDEADVLLEDQRTSTGLARAATDTRPHLVSVSMTPHGRTGPRANLPGSDLTACAVSGLSWGLGERDREPLPLPYGLPSVQAGLWGAAGALVGLHARERTGRGQWVDVAAADVMVFYAIGHALLYTSYGRRWERGGTLMGFGGEPLPCKDGFVSLVATSRQQWARLAESAGREIEEARAPEFTDFLQAMGNRARSFDVLCSWTGLHTRDELVRVAFDEGIPLAPVLRLGEALDHPALTELFENLSSGGTQTRAARIPIAVADGGTAPRNLPSDEGGAPFEGLRVVELAWNWTGPMIGQLLADFGAEVIRVESRRKLEPLRRMPPPLRRDGTPAQGDRADLNPYFHNVNRGKRSVGIDFTTPEGADALRALIARSDVVVENMGPGVLDRAGFGAEEVLKINPGIVMISAPMLPRDNPYSRIRGYAPITSSFGGLESLIGYPGEPFIGMTKVGIADPNAGVQGIVALLAAMWRRRRVGRGATVVLSQVAAVLAALPEPVAMAASGSDPGPVGAQHHHHAPHGTFPSADGGWVSVAVTADEEWSALVRTIARADLAADATLATAAGRVARRAEVDAAVASWVSTRPAVDAAESLLAAGVPAARLADFDAVLADEHFRVRGTIQDWEHHGYGPETLLGSPARLEASPPAIRRSAPDVAQDDDHVLGGVLGMSDDARARLPG